MNFACLLGRWVTKASVAVAFFCGGALAHAQTNLSFEQPGGPLPLRYVLSDSAQVPGWTLIGPGTLVYQSSKTDGIDAKEGDYYVSFGHNGTVEGGLSQSFDTTVGVRYTVNYWLSAQQGFGAGQSMLVRATDATSSQLISEVTSTISSDAFQWIPGSPLTFVATAPRTTLSFLDASLAGSIGSSAGNWGLDAISITSDSGPPTPPQPRAPVFSGSASGAITDMSISAQVSVGEADIGRSVKVYVVVLFPNGLTLFKTPTGFAFGPPYPAALELVGSDLPVTVDIVSRANLFGAQGAQIFVGYGDDAIDMINTGRFRSVLTLP